MRCSTRFLAATVVAAVSPLPLIVVAGAAGAQQSLSPALASFLAEEAHATVPDRETLLAGNPLVKLLDADPATEIAVLGAIWVNAPRSLYGLSGFTGRVIRGRVRSEVEAGTRAARTATKAKLESKGVRP